MKVALWATGLIVLTLSYARAESVPATCSLAVDGRKIWEGMCCVEQTAIGDGAGSLVELGTKSLQECVSEKKNTEQDILPTS
jgi:hypothetical protein